MTKIERRKRLVERSKAWLWDGSFCKSPVGYLNHRQGRACRLMLETHIKRGGLAGLGNCGSFSVRVQVSRTGCGEESVASASFLEKISMESFWYGME